LRREGAGQAAGGFIGISKGGPNGGFERERDAGGGGVGGRAYLQDGERASPRGAVRGHQLLEAGDVHRCVCLRYRQKPSGAVSRSSRPYLATSGPSVPSHPRAIVQHCLPRPVDLARTHLVVGGRKDEVQQGPAYVRGGDAGQDQVEAPGV
jgi:hypothetical protein